VVIQRYSESLFWSPTFVADVLFPLRNATLGQRNKIAGETAELSHTLFIARKSGPIWGNIASELCSVRGVSTCRWCSCHYRGMGDHDGRGIDLLAGAGNRPAPIYRLETIHHAREIFAGGEIAATQFPQCADPGLPVVVSARR
jgi:hypothetical protein